ncbi:MAG: hypothetical protein IKY59_00880 [Oscillospiraceae bacterium]|nr:hypothetical protein [Oscillospiraceae bacterium]
MKPLDRRLQQRVWSRVYESPRQMLNARQRESLRKCLQRCRENLAAYDKMRGHFAYQEAFAHLESQTREQIKMLQQMLEQ